MVPSHRLMAVAAGIVAAAPLAAQKSVPATYAITNARIVPVSGPAIEKGTVVIRDGVITAVGATAAVPADARIVDGAGLTVYPGLIDAYGTLGMASAAPATGAAATGGRGGRGAAGAGTAPTGAPNSNYGIGLQPEIRAVDELDPAEGAFDAAHAAGFTSALTSSGAGIFRGQSALINLDGEDVSAMVIKPGVAQHIGFSRGAGGGRGGGGGGGYPGSLMGVFAQLRQELLDAQHYRDVKAAYEKNPRGMKRPDYDPSLEALQPVLAGKQAVVMQANTQREIERALDLAKEFSLKPIIAGGSEAPKMIARLKAENVPVLLSVNYPRAGAGGGGGGFGGGGGGGRGASPDDPEPLRLLRDRVEAPKAANALAAGGVKFAIQSGANFTDFLGNMRKAVDAGLPADLALKSVTTQPAELFGVSDRLGTIEVGKIANLTVTRGDIFDPAARVTQVFVDGKPIAVTAAAATGGGGRGGRGGGGFDASGRWSVTVSVDGRDRAVTLELRQEGDRLYGVIQGSLGASEILEGGVETDGSFFFTTTVSLGSSSIEAEFDGTIDQAGIHGSVSIEDHKTGAFSGSHTN